MDVDPAWSSRVLGLEIRFYRELAGRAGVPAPRCYHAELDPATGVFALVLEDLGDRVPGHRLDGLAAVRHMFIGSASWFATFEAKTPGDARILRGHWARTAAALIAVEAAW